MYDGENLAQVSDTFKVSDTYGAGIQSVFTHQNGSLLSHHTFLKNNQKFFPFLNMLRQRTIGKTIPLDGFCFI